MKNNGVALFLSLASFFFALQKPTIAAKITFTNNCSYTVWPATLATGHQMPQLSTTGFELAIGASKSVSIPSPWSGRIWARTGCSNDSGIFVCITGDCESGQVECNGAGARPPATFAEVNTASNSKNELYHVSNVDGFNLPMSIVPKGGSGNCESSSCPENIISVCPEELQVRWSDGRVIACKSACLAFDEPVYCCTGDFNTTKKCQPTRYSQFFERQCPDASSYAYDNVRLSSNFTCSKGSNYAITFCPHNQRGSIISADLFNEMLKHRNDDSCKGKGFYAYEAFINAAASFVGFGTTGDDTTRKREQAAFFAQTSHETTGGWAGATDGPYAWGYCYVEEPSSQDRYRGRGPFQLTYDFNYKQAGEAIQEDLLNNPDLVATDAVISFKTAIWFWMTPQGNKPSSHDVITNNWTPSDADRSAGRVPGYGVITNIINGALECNRSDDPRAADRIGFYKRYCDIMQIDFGDNLDCNRQSPFS